MAIPYSWYPTVTPTCEHGDPYPLAWVQIFADEGMDGVVSTWGLPMLITRDGVDGA